MSDEVEADEASAAWSNEVAAAGRTLCGAPAGPDSMLTRLRYAAALLRSLPERPQEPALVWEAADARVQSRRIGEELIVGRGADCGVRFEEDNELSRRHFRIWPEQGVCWMEDLGSRNGAYIVGHPDRIVKRPLVDGDVILAGGQSLVFVRGL